MASDSFARCCFVVFLFSFAGLNRVSGNLEATVAQLSEKILQLTEIVQSNAALISGLDSKLTEFAAALERNDESLKEIQPIYSHVYLCRTENNDTLLCETESSGSDWIVIQQRFRGWVNFNVGWKQYREGFGEVGQDQEFWMGLERIHQLTKSGQYELLVELTDFKGETAYARYSEFVVDDEASKYRLSKLGGYSGTAGDSNKLTSGNSFVGQKFSTKDSNNANWDIDCAGFYGGGWWYDLCGYGLNSRYNLANSWKAWKEENLKYSRMLIRARQ